MGQLKCVIIYLHQEHMSDFRFVKLILLITFKVRKPTIKSIKLN